MKRIILLNKKEGETPLESLEVFRSKHRKVYKNTKMTYAGRLDPMASGLLLILADEEVKNKEKYLKLKKEYEFEILFGFSTDTYDILGKIIKTYKKELNKKELENIIYKNIPKFKGRFSQNYPIFSSKTVEGKPLFEYAREGKGVEIPKREIIVKELKFIKLRELSDNKLLQKIERRIRKVKGDFRQKEILKTWQQKLGYKKQKHFFIGKFLIKCGSGTYVRGIVNSLGEEIAIPSLAFTIARTRIGKWSKPS